MTRCKSASALAKRLSPIRLAVVRSKLLREHPELREILGRLEGVINDATMRELNRRVDVTGKLPAEVAHDFLVGAELLRDSR